MAGLDALRYGQCPQHLSRVLWLAVLPSGSVKVISGIS